MKQIKAVKAVKGQVPDIILNRKAKVVKNPIFFVPLQRLLG